MSMPIVTLSSPSKNSNSTNNEKFRDPSFSSYLNGAEETLVLKLRSTSTPSLDSTISFPYDHIFIEKSKTEDTEIDVFDAKKYFDEGLNHTDDSFEVSQMEKLTMAKRSESSCNSRNALLQSVPKNLKPEKTKKKRFFARICCNCSCSDKNSVEIDEYTRPVNGNSKQDVKFEKPENDFRFSVPVQEEGSTLVLKKWRNGVASGLSQDIKIPSNSCSDSDASSEFFEIENLSNGNPFFSSGRCDYAPSEASIEWSVITSSVADYSVLSELENTQKKGVNSKKNRAKGRSSILSGCKSHKDVGVNEDGLRANDSKPKRQLKSDPFD